MAKQTYTQQDHQDYKRHLEMQKAEFTRKYECPQKFDKTPDSFDKIKAIGSGAYGEVFLVRDKATLSYHAMKVVDKSVVVERKHVKHLLLEKRIQQSTQFPFIVSLDMVFKDNVYLYFILPYIIGGEMFNFIQRYGPFADPLAKFYASQIILALEYLHYCDCVHRDLKPENILIDHAGYIKLCDFGFCKVLKKKTWTLCGTPEYIAPEVILSKGYSFSVDWWACGVLIYEMLCGHPPFFAGDPSKLYEKILDGAFKCPDSVCSECKSLLKGLIQVDPGKRLGSLKGGVYDIKSHPWFIGLNWSQILYQKADVPFQPVVASEGDTSNFPELDMPKLKKADMNLFEDEFAEF